MTEQTTTRRSDTNANYPHITPCFTTACIVSLGAAQLFIGPATAETARFVFAGAEAYISLSQLCITLGLVGGRARKPAAREAEHGLADPARAEGEGLDGRRGDDRVDERRAHAARLLACA